MRANRNVYGTPLGIEYKLYLLTREVDCPLGKAALPKELSETM